MIKTFREFVAESTNTVKGKIQITQKENDKYFSQKLSTKRDGFAIITRTVTLIDDASEIHERGEYGYIVVGTKKIAVVLSNGIWEIESPQPKNIV